MVESHLEEPASVEIPDTVYRVARVSDPLRFSEIAAGDASLSSAGNRFDVAGGGVLYLPSDVRGCFFETLARMRPTPRMRELGKEEHFMVCGGVPASWRNKRVIVTAHCEDPLRFLDVESPVTHEYLNSMMSQELAALGVSQLDVGQIRGANRLVTRAIASWAYSATDADGGPLYSGLRYVSRVSDSECWAVFDGTNVEESAQRRAISLHDDDLRHVNAVFGLSVF